jgi:hypothetical protein
VNSKDSTKERKGYNRKKVRKDNSESKKVIALFSYVLISILVALGLYLALTATITDYYISKGFANRAMQVGDYCQNYNRSSDDDSYVILFIGSSNTMMSVDARLIESELKNQSAKTGAENGVHGYPKNFTVYNLAVAGTDNMVQSLYADCYIKMKPDMVVYGINSFSFNGDTNLDNVVVLHRYWSYDSFAASAAKSNVFSANVNDALNYNFIQRALYKRKFTVRLFIIVPFDYAKNMLRGSEQSVSVQSSQILQDSRSINNPYPLELKKKSADEIRMGLENGKAGVPLNYLDNFSEFNNSELRAFEYTAKILNENNISFVVIHYPEHYLLLEKFSKGNIANNVANGDIVVNDNIAYYKKYMSYDAKDLNFKFIDMENLYANSSYDSYFMDAIHFTPQGREDFSLVVADALIKEGAVSQR